MHVEYKNGREEARARRGKKELNVTLVKIARLEMMLSV